MLFEIELIEKYVFKVCGVELTNLKAESESQEYSAHTFELNKQKVKFRMAKITPTKTGQFVTIWKRNETGITVPHSFFDEFEFYMIATSYEKRFGIFIFNKTVLSENRVLTNKISEGKRGIRVYPTWDLTTNKQAKHTQTWQTKCFLEFTIHNKIDVGKAKTLLNLK
ncbi:MAG: MepB family protein [Sphingobacteriales bacterium]|nr:MAG: MepB family protein [Sphingobacteriales bacterium]